MTFNPLSNESKNGAFFRPIDWTAFWSATLIAFLVYFFTLGPSVGLEDSGELATAADHLGVPHPPGYPFWSLCSWVFCRVFSWVTYMGQPTPAWAVSLASAVAGAFAAGCTSMLICRSGSDMLDSLPVDGDEATEERHRANAKMGLAAGLGGSLVFAFSPVEWSQATIVEIYALNALFLMAVFLLSYRWMRKPSDRILWLTAFIFGLGLTNYQVLLLAAVPLAIIIALKNIRLFRDFVLILIPVGLTAKVLQIGSMLRANQYMSADVINKFEPILKSESCPNGFVVALGCVLVVLAPVAAFVARRRGGNDLARRAALGCGLAGAGLLFLAATVFTGAMDWTSPVSSPLAPLLPPTRYALIGALLAASCTFGVAGAFAPEGETLASRKVWGPLALAGACAVFAIFTASGIRAADAAGYAGPAFAWAKPTLLLLGGIAALFALAAFTPRGLAYAIPVAGVQIAAYVLLSKGAMNGLTNPHSWWFIWPIVWNFAVLGLAAVALPSGRAIAPAMFFAELGVSFYVYMPIVSDLRNPPMNWGYPRTWEGFKHAIMRGQYEQIKMPDFFSVDGFQLFLKQLGFYFQDLRMQFTLVAAALALVPFALWRLTVRLGGRIRRLNAVALSAAVYTAVAVLVALFSEILDGNGEVPLRLDKMLLLGMALLALAGLVLIAVRQTMVVVNMIRGVRTPEANDDDAKGFALRFVADDVSQQWLIAVGSCFALMSLFLVALAGVKGDIQDGFIQKVKFISSHGMFSLWIGYGLVVGLALANRLLARLSAAPRKALFALLCVAATLVAAIPVYENYTNEQLVFAMGSAEQNGHDFGWQFGNYQLRGANAIREELEEDEEPLPNPLYPPEMGPNAVFFGGTDPGRFVPTYMIYSANVRPDVYLITQNALADDTYMSVERDLYGDEIWIPAKEDSAESFNIYVSEVQSGKRSANADLKIENGRVQVTGALGVMEINGVLTKMMFDHEKLRRDFYVEESYVIQWMYPYLKPHGLIMKIDKDPQPVSAERARDDMEFWDWYTRRLLRSPHFRRDFPAQKSFSKLRAALAGLYAHTPTRFQNALAAYREACMLYPASPEASFRYIQEALLPLQKWNAIEDILDYTTRVDPNSGRAEGMRNYVRHLRRTLSEINRLRAKAQTAKLDARDLIALAQHYTALNRRGEAVKAAKDALAAAPGAFDLAFLAGQLLAQNGQRGDAAQAMKRAATLAAGANLDPATRREMGLVLADGGLFAEAEQALNDYLRLQGRDVEVWMKLAVVKDALGRTQEAWNAIRQAYTIDANAAARVMQADENLQRVAAPLFRRK